METDAPPRKEASLADFRKSDELVTLTLPEDDGLQVLAGAIEETLAFGQTKAVQSTCRDFLSTAAQFYGVTAPTIRVLAARPIRIWESGFHTELFGDYHIGKAVIRCLDAHCRTSTNHVLRDILEYALA